MVRLNKNDLTADKLNELFLQLNYVLGKLTADQVDSFLSNLLGPEERIMVAKRLAIIVMLNEGYSLYKISNTLKVSPATASKVSLRVQSGELLDLVQVLKENKNAYAAVIDVIESILTVGGVMPRYGKSHLTGG